MPRLSPGVFLLLVVAAPAVAQPADPLALARGLRDAGLADLAVEYVTDLAGKRPPPEVAVQLPLELALSRLGAAVDADDTQKDALLAQARGEFEQFLKTAPPQHVRRPEAAVALARAVAGQARAQLSRADNLDDAARTAARAAARPGFVDAAARFATAAEEFGKAADAKAVAQAELDRGRCLFDLARTFGDTTKDTLDKIKPLDQARSAFNALNAKDPAGPLAWVALAWAAECEREKADFTAADRLFKQVKDAKGPGAAAGQRLARFFELRAEFLAAARENKPAALQKARRLADGWLAEAPKGKAVSPEVTAARFYAATGRLFEARLQVREDPKTKAVTVPGAARVLLQEADREYRRLAEADTEYTGRAVKYRTQVVRLLVGDADRPPADFATLDESLMAAQVQIERATQLPPDDRPARAAKGVALFERARTLAGSDTSRDGSAAALGLVRAYLLADRPHQAAVLGEHLARTLPPGGPAARAGQLAVTGYLNAAGKLSPDEAEAKAVDQNHALAVAAFLDKTLPTDPSTDLARMQAAEVKLAGGDPLAAFDLLAKVSPASPLAVRARLREGAAAYALLSPADGSDPPPADQRAKVLQRAVRDLTALPEPPTSLPAADARLAVKLGLQVAELHLLDKPAGLPKAEAAAAAAASRASKFTDLTPADKQAFAFQAEHVRARAVYAQAAPLFQQGKYPEASAKLAPLLDAIKKDGPAAKGTQDPAVKTAAVALDEFRRDRLVVLGLQARVREKAVDKAGELLALLKTLGGSLDASVGAVEALVAGVKPQLDQLRKDGKGEDADTLAAGVAGLLDKLAADPAATPRVYLALGRGLTTIGRPEPAVALLQKVPQAPELLAQKFDALDDKQKATTTLDKLARLELARAHRQAGQFAEADAVLTAAVGTKEKPGWAVGSPQAQSFRREGAHLLEAKAAAADPRDAAKMWGEAYKRWGELANDYAPALKQLAAGKRDAKAAMLALLQLKALPPSDKLPKTPDDIRKGLTAAPPPPWLADLLAPVKAADGAAEDNPYVRQLRDAVAKLDAQVKPVYFDLFAESLRCLTAANTATVKDPAKLAAQLGKVAAQMVQVEKANPDLADEVKAKFAAVRADSPALKAQYEKLAADHRR